MNHNDLVQVALFTPLPQHFDYLLPEDAKPESYKIGARVLVPFGARTLVGVIIGFASETTLPRHKLKPVNALLDKEPILTETLTKLAYWLNEYYHHPLGDVYKALLPNLLTKGADASYENITTKAPLISAPAYPLNDEQLTAVTRICQSLDRYQTFVLDGVTGSGKTEVYLQVIAEVLLQGKQALLLVPEIGLTPQMIARFKARFKGEIAIFHSHLSDKARLRAWLDAKSGAARIILGTRSAIFTPAKALGLIIVDESHDLSFKQQDSLRYHARDVAVKRAQLENIPIILGSATHALETLHNARFEMLQLTSRPKQATLPTFELLDIRNQTLKEGISPEVIKQIGERLARQEQVLFFLNRRGFAPILICHECGWIAECNRCDAKYTYHINPIQLRCHHCDAVKAKPSSCPSCQSTQLIPLGLGTVKIEKILSQTFKEANIVRIDRDSTRRKNALDNLLLEIESGSANILIGTQMLAKGHDFPNVTLVVIIDGDSGFFSADFRSTERFAQTLLQVSGRAGRSDKRGHVIIQTRQPEHPHLQTLIKKGYHALAESLLQERSSAKLPPYSFLALIRARAKKEEYAANFLQAVKMLNTSQANIQLYGPVASPMLKRGGNFHYQLLIQATERQSLKTFLSSLNTKIRDLPLVKKVKWSLDVDPVDLF